MTEPTTKETRAAKWKQLNTIIWGLSVSAQEMDSSRSLGDLETVRKEGEAVMVAVDTAIRLCHELTEDSNEHHRS